MIVKGTLTIVIKELFGYCPVQGEGTINGERFYFRARGEHWSMAIGVPDEKDPNSIYSGGKWNYDEPYGNEAFAAGWMPLEEAAQFIAKAAYFWIREQETIENG